MEVDIYNHCLTLRYIFINVLKHWTNNIISNICRLLYIFILTFVLAVNLLTIGIESIGHGVSGKRNIETSSIYY